MEEFRLEVNNLYKTYRRLYRMGLLRKEYTLTEIFEGVKKQKELIANG